MPFPQYWCELLETGILGYFSGNKDCVLYLGFDRYTGARVLDTSAQGNNASLANGASVTKVAGSCAVCAQLLGGNIVIQGKGFRGVPQQEITIAFMIQLLDTKGILKLFETIGSHSTHTLRKSIFHYPILLAVIKYWTNRYFFSLQTNFYLCQPKHFLFHLAQYRLEAEDGKLLWFHRNTLGNTVFGVQTDQPVLVAGIWSHVLVTYTAVSGKAQIFIDGQLLKEETTDSGVPLSTDWGKYAGRNTSNRGGSMQVPGKGVQRGHGEGGMGAHFSSKPIL